MTEIKSGLPSHSTAVDTTSAWDNGTNERRVKSPSTKAYYRRIYAWLDDGADETRKSSYRFIHHMVSADGTPGAANFRALAAGIAALNGSRRGTVLDDAGRNAVHRHLAAHYEDAGRQAPPLLGKTELDDIFNSMEVKSDEIKLGSQVVVSIDGEEIFGTVVENEEGKFFVREWTLEEDSWLPTEDISDFSSDLVQAKEFIYIGDFPDDDEEDEEEDTDNIATIKSEETEMTEQDFEILVKSIAKLVIAEIGVNVTPGEKADMMPMDPSMGEADDTATDAEDVMGESMSLVPALQAALNNVVPLYFAAHRAHWNVQGQDFSEYHELFAEIYEDVYGSIDPLAENIRKIGGFPMGLNSMVSAGEVKDDSTTTDARELAADLAAKNMDVLEMMKEIFKACNDADEQGIANFIAERIDMHEKWNWQLTASVAEAAENVAKSDEVEEVKSENVEESAEVAEEAPAEEAPAEEAHGCGEDCNCEKADAEGEKAIALTYEDLKEFSDLVKML